MGHPQRRDAGGVSAPTGKRILKELNSQATGTGLATRVSMKTRDSAALGLVMGLLVLSHATPAHAGADPVKNSRGVAVEVGSASAGQVAVVPPGTERGTLAEDREYAKRERASPDAKTYEAGQPVVIGASAVVVILLVVIIIIVI